MTIALYPGTFDPVTNGHVDIIGRAAALFEELVVGVYETPSKNLLFSADERVQLLEEAISGLRNVRVAKYQGMTITFAQQIGARVMIRGLRAVTDFEYEFPLAIMNKRLAPNVETVALYATVEYQLVSSSLLKEVASLGGSVRTLVPPNVETALQKVFAAKRRTG